MLKGIRQYRLLVGSKKEEATESQILKRNITFPSSVILIPQVFSISASSLGMVTDRSSLRLLIVIKILESSSVISITLDFLLP